MHTLVDLTTRFSIKPVAAEWRQVVTSVVSFSRAIHPFGEELGCSTQHNSLRDPACLLQKYPVIQHRRVYYSLKYVYDWYSFGEPPEILES